MQAQENEENRNAAIAAADRLHSAAIHLLRWLRASDRESGIGPAQLSALSVLVFGGPQSLADLAQAEQVKAPTMSRIVGGLLQAKLATSREDERDRRAVIIRATGKGIRLMNTARRRRIETLVRAVRGLSEKEVAELGEAAQLMESLSRRL
jgi:DNA-binding MarR family transcriptional regulator